MSKYLDVMDGNMAAAYISYAFTEVAGIYPITPSSTMAEYVDEWAAKGKKNLFGQPVEIVEMQSEGGAAGTVHGSLAAGSLTTTYTASQGLLLMVPNMYKIAGELLPGVFHVSARSLSIHALSIFGDHSDVMATRQTGFALLASSSPQEAMDLGAVAHLSAISSRVPFLHFFDGFRTSHEQQKIEVLDYEDLRPLMDMEAVKAFRKNALHPSHPCIRGTTVNPDIYFQGREAQNKFYNAIPEIVGKYMCEINRITGRNYQLYEYYGDENAEYMIVSMGSVSETIRETIDYLRTQGKKVGLLAVRLYRPFSIDHFLKAIPASVKRIAVLDRTKEPGSTGEPLYLDVCNAYYQKNKPMVIVGGRYGLSSKDTTPAQIAAVYNNLESAEPKNNFTVGIEDDVTFLSLPIPELPEMPSAGRTSCKIWGFGSDGTVGANKNTIKIIGSNTDLYAQAYFAYDSKKSGGLTQSHLRFGKDPIRSTYYVSNADFVACHKASYIDNYNLTKDLKQGGTFLLNCPWKPEALGDRLPAQMKADLCRKNAQLYIIDAVEIARSIGLGNRINAILQAAFFKLVNILPMDDAIRYMKEAIQKTYGKKGPEVVQKNFRACDEGVNSLIKVEIPASWADAKEEKPVQDNLPDFVRNVIIPVNRQEGDLLPVSMYNDIPDGTWLSATTQYEKRGVAIEVPKWIPENCIQCNQCSLVCPHATIRPFLLDEAEQEIAPEGFKTLKAMGKDLGKYTYRMQVSPYDCTGCGVCANVCPAKTKALKMIPFDEQRQEQENWTFAMDKISMKQDAINDRTVKSSQFAQPLFEFSGACAGCAETPYIKLITQLFGDHMYVANASGCSSAYGGSPPAIPYSQNKKGEGPAWAMSLFEDNAEYAYGMLLGSEKIRSDLADRISVLLDTPVSKEANEYLELRDDRENSRRVSNALIEVLQSYKPSNEKIAGAIEYIMQNKEYLHKKSYWAFGGDGWAYDIGYGGLDHVLASGKNINMLVMDTEVYSNTGGQSSKASPLGSVAKFAATGKKTEKKDLGLMLMSYGYVYVAQIAMGASQAQTLQAIREAEAYEGPSIVIAYCPCIEHGPKVGMGKSQQEQKTAVEAGYWHLYRYNPDLKKEGKNPFTLDSKDPTGDFKAFLRGEVRYSSLELIYPKEAEELFEASEQSAKERLGNYKKLANV